MSTIDTSNGGPGTDPQSLPWPTGGETTGVLQVVSVAYHGDDQTDVYRDVEQTPYESPQWLDANEDGDASDPGDRAYPVGYKRGVNLDLDVTIQVEPPGSAIPPSLHLYWFGFGPHGVVTEVVYEGRPETEYSRTVHLTTTTPLVSYVHAYLDFDIDWRFTWADAPPEPTVLGSYSFQNTSNPLYATLERSFGNAYHTLIFNATVSAEGATNGTQAIEMMWSQYQTYSLVWKEPPTNWPAERKLGLYYYFDWGTENDTHEDLIREGDGQCAAWVLFWRAELFIQGVPGAELGGLVELSPPEGSEVTMFLVKNWDLHTPSFPNDPFPYRATWSIEMRPYARSQSILNGNHFTFDLNSEDLEDLPGVKGQGRNPAELNVYGNPNPKSLFNRHYVMLLNGKYYDPSYGITYDTLAAWENESVALFAAAIPNGLKAYANPDGEQIVGTLIDWE